MVRPEDQELLDRIEILFDCVRSPRLLVVDKLTLFRVRNLAPKYSVNDDFIELFMGVEIAVLASRAGAVKESIRVY